MAGFGNHFPFDIGKEVKNCESLLDNNFYCNMSSQTLVIAIQLSHRLAVGQLSIGQMVRSFLSLSSTNASKGRVTKGRWYLRLRLQWQQPAGAPLNRKLKFVGSHPAAKKIETSGELNFFVWKLSMNISRLHFHRGSLFNSTTGADLENNLVLVFSHSQVLNFCPVTMVK